MALLELGRHNWEAIASAPAAAHTTRFVVESLLEDGAADADAQLQIGRLNWEAIAAAPEIGKTTRYVVEVMHEDGAADSNAAIILGRLNWETIAQVDAEAKTTRYVVEVMHKDGAPDSASAIIVGRLGFEALARRFLKIEACPIPNFWRYFSHNYSDVFEIETTFRTSISRAAESLSEDRTQLFQRPRRTVDVRWSEKGLDNVTTGGKTNLMELIQALRTWKTEDWMIPLSSDEACITEAASGGQPVVKGDFSRRRFFIGGRVAVVKTLGDRGDVQTPEGVLSGVHVTTIADKTDDNEYVLQDNLPFDVEPFRAFMVPLICTHPRLLDTIDKVHGRLWDLNMEFEERGGPTAIPPLVDDIPAGFDVYRNMPIFRADHDYNRPLQIEVLQEGVQRELGRGKITAPRGDTSRVKHRIRIVGDREYAWPYIEFFESRRGRLRVFWLIDQEDLFQVTDIETNFIDVKKLGDFTEFEKDNEFFGFMLSDGSCYVREIISIADLPTAWRLSVADTLPAGLDFQDVKMAGRARNTRMIEDSLKERWSNNNVVRMEVPTISTLEEKDVTLDP